MNKAPSFCATALINGKDVIKDFSLDQYLDKQYVVFIFYPKDFSGVCPTEMWAFQDRLGDFQQRGAVVVSCSVDTEEVHKAWVNTSRDKNGIEGITFPIISDASKTISINYNTLGGEYFYDEEGGFAFEGAPIPFRGTFIINKKGVVMYESINFFTIARDVDTVLRELDAIQHFETTGEACLANWKK